MRNKNNTISIKDKVAFLRQKNIYPDKPHNVAIKETHMSYVFLTNNYVYKLKKPVKYAFLDFSTLEARFESVKREISLNQRLAGNTYIGIMNLSLDEKNNLHLNQNSQKKGSIVDYIIKMRRLPDIKMLENKIKNKTLKKEDIIKVAMKLSHFYGSAKIIEINWAEYLKKFQNEIQKSCNELNKEQYKLSNDRNNKITQQLLCFAKNNKDIFLRRIQNQKIIEGHGDLRPEHIFLMKTPIIIDCLEFNKELRTLDIADELSYFCMECDILGANWVTHLIFDEYTKKSGDEIPKELIAFYKSYRALLRARLSIQHLLEPQYQRDGKWKKQCEKYLEYAVSYCENLIY